MRYKLSVYNILEYGRRVDAAGNPHQEDSLFPVFGSSTEADRLFILCDGMGGHDAGEVASSTVCEAMSSTILENIPDPEGSFDINTLRRAINAAYEQLDAKDTGAVKKMGTTMTMLKLYDKGAVIAHIGDSRVYHIRPGKDADSTRVLYRTWDHSLVYDYVRIGMMTEDEAKKSSQRNVITKAMQPDSKNRCIPTIKKIRDIRPGDYFFLCSDGMLEQMDIPELSEIFSAEGGDDLTKVQSLIKITEKNHDNHSAIIVHIHAVIDPIDDTVEPDEFDNNYSDTFDGLTKLGKPVIVYESDDDIFPVTQPEAPTETEVDTNVEIIPEPKEPEISEPQKPKTPETSEPQEPKTPETSEPQEPKTAETSEPQEPKTPETDKAEPTVLGGSAAETADHEAKRHHPMAWLVAGLSVAAVAVGAWMIWPSHDVHEGESDTPDTTEVATDAIPPVAAPVDSISTVPAEEKAIGKDNKDKDDNEELDKKDNKKDSDKKDSKKKDKKDKKEKSDKEDKDNKEKESKAAPADNNDTPTTPEPAPPSKETPAPQPAPDPQIFE